MADEKKEASHQAKQQAKPQAKPQPAAQPQVLKSTAKEGVSGIVRLAGKDVDGGLAVKDALCGVRGIGKNLAASLVRVLEQQMKLDTSTPIGSLTEQQADQVEEVIKAPQNYGVPAFLMNRQKDNDTGKPAHLLMTDLGFAMKQDIQKEKEMRTWIGWRHSIGQKVRGQHTRTTGRTGMTVGVLKKAIKSMKAAAATSAQEAGKAKK
ncbi:MAG: 30S ribosomal protein S13 [Candidatus Micrarchaeota archaeon]|nr:30S ribosomal protein S13 [Candidatus Micrarchaeota archaeon]